MIKTFAGWIAAACVGAALGYQFGSRTESARREVAASPPAASINGASTTARPAAVDEDVRTRTQAQPLATDAASRGTATDASITPATPLQASVLNLRGGKLDANVRSSIQPLAKLLDTMSAYCTLDAGAGGQWPHGRILAHTAAWQGGPLEFDTIDLAEETAQLTRHPWAVASAESAIPLAVTATNSGLHFSGFKPDGELLAMTIFGTLDSEGRYRAVLSLHGTKLDHESAQFYGWCTIR